MQFGRREMMDRYFGIQLVPRFFACQHGDTSRCHQLLSTTLHGLTAAWITGTEPGLRASSLKTYCSRFSKANVVMWRKGADAREQRKCKDSRIPLVLVEPFLLSRVHSVRNYRYILVELSREIFLLFTHPFRLQKVCTTQAVQTTRIVTHAEPLTCPECKCRSCETWHCILLVKNFPNRHHELVFQDIVKEWWPSRLDSRLGNIFKGDTRSDNSRTCQHGNMQTGSYQSRVGGRISRYLQKSV